MTKQATLEKIQVKAKINHQEYLQIPNTNFIIAEYEPDWTKNFDYENSHKQVLQEGLQIPTPGLFMPHFVNVIDAYHNKSQLYDASGAQVIGDRLNKLYEKFTHNSWSWLNARFVPGSGFNNMDLETVTGLDANGNLLTKKEYLEPCLMEDCFADFKFNKQGLATKKSKVKSYKQGENIKFWYPRENYVERFDAYSYGAFFYCDGGPGGSFPALGVFSVCETNTCNKFRRKINKLKI